MVDGAHFFCEYNILTRCDWKKLDTDIFEAPTHYLGNQATLFGISTMLLGPPVTYY